MITCLFQVFLSSELQAAQIVRSKQASDKQQDESPENQELLAICETLKLPEPRGSDAAGVLSQIQNKVGLLSTSVSAPQNVTVSFVLAFK